MSKTRIFCTIHKPSLPLKHQIVNSSRTVDIYVEPCPDCLAKVAGYKIAYDAVCEKLAQRILDLEKKLKDIYTQQVTPVQIDFHLKDGPNG